LQILQVLQVLQFLPSLLHILQFLCRSASHWRPEEFSSPEPIRSRRSQPVRGSLATWAWVKMESPPWPHWDESEQVPGSEKKPPIT
jgi:hypothetical protein